MEGSAKGSQICDAIKLYFGWDCNKDRDKSFQIFNETIKKDIFIDQKETNISIFFVALSYHYGHGTNKDINKAVDYYNQAIQLENSKAMLNLAIIYQYGLEGTKKDSLKAIELYTQASDLGNSVAMYNLARIYENASLVGKDIPKAIQLYEKASIFGVETAKKKLEELTKK